MASKASGFQPLKKNKLQKFDAALYEKIPLINLIIYAVHYLNEQGARTSMEDIVFACFLLFPKKFALKKYTKWPDSALVARRLSDGKSKRLVSGNSELGFSVTFKGTRISRKVAKGLGVPFDKPKKERLSRSATKKKTQSVQTKAKQSQTSPAKIRVPSKTVKPRPAPSAKSRTRKTQAKKTKVASTTTPPVSKKKVPAAKSIQPIRQTKTSQGTKRIPHLPVKKVHSPKQASKNKPVQPKAKVSGKKQAAKQSALKKTSVRSTVHAKKQQVQQPVAKKEQVPAQSKIRTKKQKAKQPAIHKKQVTEQAQVRVKKVQTKQSTLKKKKTSPPVQQKLPFPIAIEKAYPSPKAASPAQLVVTKEVKVRAGKFVRVIEKSDAYKLYQKNGKHAKISEFDFRSLLLCTMESSSETLARNVNLYKGYAGIHNRQDLITFLTFCEEYFSPLLMPTPKKVRR